MDAVPQQPGRARLVSIDLLRGLVMVVMLLDHTRDFVHREGLSGEPLDPATTTPLLFFTRWITHFCAPVFVLLAGTAARLQATTRPTAAVAAGLWRRGLFLVALELLVLRPLIWFQLDLALLAHLQVIWAIGWSMCGLSLLLRCRLPPAAIGGLGVVLVATHNLLTHVHFHWLNLGSSSAASTASGLLADLGQAVQIVLFQKGALQFGPDGPVAFVQYPLLPWFGVMAVGYWLGTAFNLAAAPRRRWLLGLGLAATAGFVLLRTFGAYGDPLRWSAAPDFDTAVYMFLRTEKYPPSLHYVLMTLGPALLLLWAFDQRRGDGPLRWLIAIGRAPLFFYILQWPAVHLLSRALQWFDGQPLGWDAPNLRRLGEPLPPGCGFSLGMVYVAWILGLAVLVPLTLAFAAWKARHPERRWLRFL